MNSILRDQRGVVMMEFMLALFPVMMAFLAVTQFCFLGVGKLMVRHSAVVAARAAVVVIEESEEVLGTPPGIYGGEQAGEVVGVSQSQSGQGSTGTSSGAKAGGAALEGIAQLKAPTGEGSSGVMEAFGQLANLASAFEGRDATRIDQIRTAAYIPMLGVSPDVLDMIGAIARAIENPRAESLIIGMNQETVEDAIGTRGYRRLAGALLYNLGMLAVSFPERPGSKQYKEGIIPLTIEKDEDDDEVLSATPVTVRVSYLFRCMVPIAAVLICESGLTLAGIGDSYARTFWNARRMNVHGMPSDPGAMQAYMEGYKEAQAEREQNAAKRKEFEERAPEFENVEAPGLQTALLYVPGARYYLMTADATLPLQAARYYHRKEH